MFQFHRQFFFLEPKPIGPAALNTGNARPCRASPRTAAQGAMFLSRRLLGPPKSPRHRDPRAWAAVRSGAAVWAAAGWAALGFLGAAEMCRADKVDVRGVLAGLEKAQ